MATIVVIALATALGLCGPAQAALSGADFLQADPGYQKGFIEGFVRGMYLTCLDHMETKKQICSFEPLLDTLFEMTPEQVLEQLIAHIKAASAEARQKEVSEALINCLRATASKPR